MPNSRKIGGVRFLLLVRFFLVRIECELLICYLLAQSLFPYVAVEVSLCASFIRSVVDASSNSLMESVGFFAAAGIKIETDRCKFRASRRKFFPPRFLSWPIDWELMGGKKG